MDLADAVAAAALSCYASLPNNGKPQRQEWTVLAAIVAEHECHDRRLQVLSLATGNKCVGADRMSDQGQVLNDSHAEALARRGFIRCVRSELRDPCADLGNFLSGCSMRSYTSCSRTNQREVESMRARKISSY
jgi:hypothetical protein